jgi:hypothetical protein
MKMIFFFCTLSFILSILPVALAILPRLADKWEKQLFNGVEKWMANQVTVRNPERKLKCWNAGL